MGLAGVRVELGVAGEGSEGGSEGVGKSPY